MRIAAMCFFMLVSIASQAAAQSYRTTITTGNDRYHEERYEEAARAYERAIHEEPKRPEAYFNRGNTAYRKNDPLRALADYRKGGEYVRDPETGARFWYNAGNTFLKAGQYDQAVEAFKHSLKLNPHDEDARYNLLYAMMKREESRSSSRDKSQRKNQDRQQKQDQKTDQQQEKNREKQDDQKQERKDHQQQERENQRQQEQRQQDKQEQPRDQRRMSRQQAEQILNALERDEKDLQKKLREKRAVRIRVEKDW
ncbi:MAG: tetratricopeptide repeat protein [Bacteroidota bacterium]|nr:tetratricopeptide repeat protein [Bacteroidota bacterium]